MAQEGGEYTFPVYGTQDGGLVRREGDHYVFVEPPDWGGYKVGDKMPEEWGVASANKAAQDEMDSSIDPFEDDGFPDDDMGEPDYQSDAFAQGCERSAGDHTEDLERVAAKQEAEGTLERFRSYESDADRGQFVRSLQPDQLGFFLDFSSITMEERQFVIDIANPVPNI